MQIAAALCQWRHCFKPGQRLDKVAPGGGADDGRSELVLRFHFVGDLVAPALVLA